MHQLYLVNECALFIEKKGYLLCNLVLFSFKSRSVTQKLVSKKGFLKTEKKPVAFFRKSLGSNNSFTLIEKNFRFLR